VYGDKAFKEVTKEKTIASIWRKLESLYMTKIFDTQTLFEATVVFVPG